MFEWDEAKAANNLRKHGVPFEFAVQVFDDPARVEFDVSRPRDSELRRKCVGRIDDKLFVVVFHERGNNRRIIRRAAQMPTRTKPMPTVRMTAKQARTVRLTGKQARRLAGMTDDEITTAARTDPDNPPLTDTELALVRRGGRPKADDPKRLVSLRLDSDVVERLRASGPGWQSRANAALRRAVKLGPKTAPTRKRSRG